MRSGGPRHPDLEPGLPGGLRDFQLEVHFSQWEFTARHNLAASDAETLSVADLLELAGPAARDEFFGSRLGYTETSGAGRLRTSIAGTYDSISAADVLCFAGAQEAIYVAMNVILEPHDHCIVLVPNYQSAESIPLGICRVDGVSMHPEEGWEPDVSRIRKALRPNTKLIVVNFPNNPTGCVPRLEVFQELVDLCRERGIWLFCDEVYRLLGRHGGRILPQVADLYEKGISLNVMSKAYGLAGLRVGWLVCRDASLRSRMGRFKHYLSICNAGPSEILARWALAASEAILERNRGIVDHNVDKLAAFLGAHGDLFEWTPSDGGCVGYVRYTGPADVEVFCRRAVREAGVLLLPASVFRSEIGSVPTDRFRIGFGRADFGHGLAVLAEWLEGELLS